MVILHGINNCSTVKRTKIWLQQQEINFIFHDLDKQGLNPAKLQHWLKLIDWQLLLNKRSTSWRNLPEEQQRQIIDATSAYSVMLEQPKLLKRPLIEWSEQQITIGFQPDVWQQIIGLG